MPDFLPHRQHFVISPIPGSGVLNYSLADILTLTDHYPFGALMPNRHLSHADYRYGFNGKENDDEVYNNTGSQYNYGFRVYDPRIAKFLSVDPLFRSYVFYAPYQFAGNNPIKFIDLDGLEPAEKKDTTGKTKLIIDYEKNKHRRFKEDYKSISTWNSFKAQNGKTLD